MDESKEPETNAAAARKAFGYAVLAMRDKAGYTSAAAVSAAISNRLSEGTIESICGGKRWPQRSSVELIVEAYEESDRVPEARDLLTLFDEASQFCNPKSPQYGKPWPVSSAESQTTAPRSDLKKGQEARSFGLDNHADGHMGRFRLPSSKSPDDSPAADETPLAADEPLEPHEATSAKNPHRHVPRWVPVSLLIALLVVLGLVAVLVGVMADESPDTPEDGSSAIPPSAGATASTASTAKFTFDALGGTSSKIINVYAGPGSSPSDKERTGSFPTGEVATAVCKATGRTITSDSAAGEQKRSSDQWVRLEPLAGEVWFATLTYGRINPGQYDALPRC